MRGYMTDVRQKTYLYHNLQFPAEYRARQGGPSWAQSAQKVAHEFAHTNHYSFLAEYPELYEDTVTPIFR
eukprot:CAMPEP_0174749854 /NCGR_PEP_ID=MMETSP1094-20130205/96551_1 /TAXON_ID=156173 /ORGANISM="Chrysochromulina brevifilum, Strain UTEX LB 985" /LENGTH=69 /DNA_ID=CAMNT_0015955113 /DNA_START=1 /DNA_END=210 /DNA_ORIENTATION=-